MLIIVRYCYYFGNLGELTQPELNNADVGVGLHLGKSFGKKVGIVVIAKLDTRMSATAIELECILGKRLARNVSKDNTKNLVLYKYPHKPWTCPWEQEQRTP